MGGQQHRLIAGDIGLRRQHIQALGAGGARGGLQGKGGNAALGHLGDGFVVERIEHPHHNGAALDQSKLAVAGGDHLQNQLCTKRLTDAANDRTSGFIGTVGDARTDASTALNNNLMTLADQLLNGFGGSSNPRFASCCL
ncbi:hypothetical protein D3C75_459590 [compost metagenome]